VGDLILVRMSQRNLEVSVPGLIGVDNDACSVFCYCQRRHGKGLFWYIVVS